MFDSMVDALCRGEGIRSAASEVSLSALTRNIRGVTRGRARRSASARSGWPSSRSARSCASGSTPRRAPTASTSAMMVTTTTARTKPRPRRPPSGVALSDKVRRARRRITATPPPPLRSRIPGFRQAEWLARLGDAPGRAGRRVHELDAALLERAPDLDRRGRSPWRRGPPRARRCAPRPRPDRCRGGRTGARAGAGRGRRPAGAWKMPSVAPQAARSCRSRASVRRRTSLAARLRLVEQLVGQHERLVEVAERGGRVEVVVQRRA